MVCIRTIPFKTAIGKRLTKAELRCAIYLQQGFCPKEIAGISYNSPQTIEKHIISLREKMQARSLIHLVSKLLQQTEGIAR